jgi:hypothetical protein
VIVVDVVGLPTHYSVILLNFMNMIFLSIIKDNEKARLSKLPFHPLLAKKCIVWIISSQSITMCNLTSDWTKMIKNKEVSICLKLKDGIAHARICTCEEGALVISN